MDIAQENVDEVQRRARFTQKGHNWCRIMEVWLWHWNHWKKLRQLQPNVKVLLTVFFDCNSHKVILPIRNTTWSYAPNAQSNSSETHNCGKTKDGFCKMITHLLTHIAACAWVFGEKQSRSHASTTVFTGLGPSWLFRFPKLKTPIKGNRFEEIKETSKQELWAMPRSLDSLIILTYTIWVVWEARP